MVLPSYSSLYASFTNNNPLLGDFPSDTNYSIPVCAQRNGGLYDAFFLYAYPSIPSEHQRKSNQFDPYRPFAWGTFSSNGSPQKSFSWCHALDFVPTEQFPLSSTVSGKLPAPLTPGKQRELYQKIIQAYEQIRLFAFKPDITPDQLRLISTYKKLFEELAPEGLHPFYYALSPEFFRWIRLPMPTTGVDATQSLWKESLCEELTKSKAELVTEIEELMATKEQESLLSKMHEELQDHRKGMLESYTLPLERDVIMVIDSIQKNLDFLRIDVHELSAKNHQRLLDMYSAVEQDLVDLLYRQGVDPYTVEDDLVILPQQKVISTVPTDELLMDKKVAERLALGWEKQGKIIRPEYVVAYLYEGNEPKETTAPTIKAPPPKNGSFATVPESEQLSLEDSAPEKLPEDDSETRTSEKEIKTDE